MPHPLLSLAGWGLILARTVGALGSGFTWTGWRVVNREDHPIAYWTHIVAGVIVIVIFPLYCLPGWIALFRNYDQTFALFLQGR